MLDQQEATADDEPLRQTLVAFLHVDADRYGALRETDNLGDVFAPLEEIGSSLLAVERHYAALKLAVPPLLRGERLREVLGTCLRAALGAVVPVSLRILAEAVSTLHLVEELVAEEPGEGHPTLCLADERAVGQVTFPLLDLRRRLREDWEGSLRAPFPLSHYDVLVHWPASTEPVMWGPERSVQRTYQSLLGREVSVAVRGLGDLEALLAFLEP